MVRRVVNHVRSTLKWVTRKPRVARIFKLGCHGVCGLWRLLQTMLEFIDMTVTHFTQRLDSRVRHLEQRHRGQSHVFPRSHWVMQVTHGWKNRETYYRGEKWPCIWCTKDHFPLAVCVLFFLGFVVCLSQCKPDNNGSGWYCPMFPSSRHYC